MSTGLNMKCARACAEVCALPNTLADPSFVQPPVCALSQLPFSTMHVLAVTTAYAPASSLVVTIMNT